MKALLHWMHTYLCFGREFKWGIFTFTILKTGGKNYTYSIMFCHFSQKIENVVNNPLLMPCIKERRISHSCQRFWIRWIQEGSKRPRSKVLWPMSPGLFSIKLTRYIARWSKKNLFSPHLFMRLPIGLLAYVVCVQWCEVVTNIF